LTERLSGYVLTGAEADHVRSIEYRAITELGSSVMWVDLKHELQSVTSLRTDLALRHIRESRFQYFPSRLNLPDFDLVGPKFAAAFRHELSKDVIFTEDLEVFPNLLGASRVLVQSLSKLSSRLTESLALTASFLVTHDSAPAQGKVPTDTALSVGLDVSL
jgi:hypothetical protein